MFTMVHECEQCLRVAMRDEQAGLEQAGQRGATPPKRHKERNIEQIQLSIIQISTKTKLSLSLYMAVGD